MTIDERNFISFSSFYFSMQHRNKLFAIRHFVFIGARSFAHSLMLATSTELLFVSISCRPSEANARNGQMMNVEWAR